MPDVAQFRIQLERPSGVYYAGEVVRGEVILETRNDINCRAVRVRLRGYGRSHWSEGSGDNRRDFDGYKVYQEERFTMFGNYFNTAMLDGAGSDAVFGHAAGDGVMFMPVEERELDSSLKLVIRVMDYDFGKRDDLLGEVLVDARELTECDGEVTLQLMRKGKPARGEDGAESTVTLAADVVPLEKFFVKAGENAGMATHILRLQALRANNLRKADWIGKNDVYVQAYRAPADMNEDKAFPEPNKKAVLPAGRHVYPFVFTLRVDAPGSAEIVPGVRCFVRYEIYANIDKAFWLDPSTKRAISVLPNRPLPKLSLLGPAFTTLSEEASTCDCCGCMCGHDGEVTVKLTVDRQAFASGEPFGFEVVAENQAQSTSECRIFVRRAILRQVTSKYSSHSSTIFVEHEIVKCNVAPGETLIVNGKDSDYRVPQLQPSFFGASGSQTAARDPLLWTYALHAKLKILGNMGCGSATDVLIPIMISPAAPYPELLTEVPPMVELRSPTRSSDVLGKYWSIKEQAHLSLARNPFFPTITGEEDIAGVASVAPAGEVVNIWIREDDNATVVGQEDLQFQPVSIVWDAPPHPVVVDAVVVGEAKTGDPRTFRELLNDMSMGDTRRAVADWVLHHPGEAAALGPDEVAMVLRNVSFSLEQPSIARELAAALSQANPTNLTTSHVVAAMHACSFAKADVAIAMVSSGLADPENIEVILDATDKWERSRVERAIIDT
mmetsp:Transcript_6314/g.24587  ORF Transcript_6314/g.24587 Transcript_6314/m.24587 type:complete len:724 (-) Transcript_6314:173-2344(-)